MSPEQLTADLKTRVSPSVKQDFQRLAESRHLDVADLVREALLDYLARHGQPVAEKAEVAA